DPTLPSAGAGGVAPGQEPAQDLLCPGMAECLHRRPAIGGSPGSSQTIPVRRRSRQGFETKDSRGFRRAGPYGKNSPEVCVSKVRTRVVTKHVNQGPRAFSTKQLRITRGIICT